MPQPKAPGEALPSGWEWCPVSKVLRVRAELTAPDRPGETVLLHTPQLNEPEIRDRNRLPVGTTQVYAGDLLYAPGGARLVPDSPLEQRAEQLLGLYRVDQQEPLFDHHYLQLMMKTAYFRSLLPVDLRIATEKPADSLRIIERRFIQGKLPRPLSIDVQQRVVVRVHDFLAQVDSCRGAVIASQAEVSALERHKRLPKDADTRRRLDRIKQLTGDNEAMLRTLERAILARAIRGEL